jgi:hypothetical protein
LGLLDNLTKGVLFRGVSSKGAPLCKHIYEGAKTYNTDVSLCFLIKNVAKFIISKFQTIQIV